MGGCASAQGLCIYLRVVVRVVVAFLKRKDLFFLLKESNYPDNYPDNYPVSQKTIE